MVPGQSASGAQGGMDTETNGMSRSMSRQRTCIPCPCRPQGMEPSLPCRPGVVNRAYARACAGRRMPGDPVVPRHLPSGCVCRRIREEMECLKQYLRFLYAGKDKLTMRFDALFQTRLIMPLPDAVNGSDVGPIVVSLQMRGVRQKPEAMTATAGKAKRRES